MFRNGIIFVCMSVKILLRACEHKETNKQQEKKCSRQDAQQEKKRINRQTKDEKEICAY